jgi:hypothetical protein
MPILLSKAHTWGSILLLQAAFFGYVLMGVSALAVFAGGL